MNGWKKIRISFLAITFGGVCFALGKSILYPSVSDRTPLPFVFPPAVSLPEWQPVASSPLVSTTEESSNYLVGRHYRYIKQGLSLDIEMRYLVQTDGNVNFFIKKYKTIPSSPGQLLPVLRQQEGVGSYNLFVHQGRAYLSTCINPRGGSTVTNNQFILNRYLYDVRLGRLLPWLLGQVELRDMRCLWAHMSVPLNNSSPENAYKTLEKAWVSWYKWWSPRFPNP
jgi:cyanosortase A-associated protein